MVEKLSDATIKKLVAPASGNRVVYDTDIKGFGVRITASGALSFVMNYRAHGRERRMTIGGYPAWDSAKAREKAKSLRRMIDDGRDPLEEKDIEAELPTIADLAERFMSEHVAKRRDKTAHDYRASIDRLILPRLGRVRVVDVRHADIDALHRYYSKDSGTGDKFRRGTPTLANRAVAVLSSMFSTAIKWEMRTDNPAIGIERNQETKRKRYLSADELSCLTTVLASHPEKDTANVIRLLLLTGARKGEVLNARWEQIDFEEKLWIKPGATTKQKTEHRAQLSAPALKLLSEIYAQAEKTKRPYKKMSPWVFPGSYDKETGEEKPIGDVKHSWASIIRKATVLLWSAKPTTPAGRLVKELTKGDTLPAYAAIQALAVERKITLPAGMTDLHIHDLRHSFASMLASAGLSLPVIGALLGHTQPSTTARYAHLFDDPLRAAVEKVGQIVTDAGKTDSAEIIPLRGKS